jgi:hypothetical protein
MVLMRVTSSMAGRSVAASKESGSQELSRLAERKPTNAVEAGQTMIATRLLMAIADAAEEEYQASRATEKGSDERTSKSWPTYEL